MISFPEILLRLAMALLLGAAIGFERELKEHFAGMRTLALVSIGSALFTIVSAYGFLALLGNPHLVIDPTRIASYIVAGIAATIWVVAAIGLACGAGLLLEAGTTTVMVLFVLVLLSFVEKAIVPHISPGTHHIHIEVSSVSGQLIATVYEICARNKITIEKLHLHTHKEREALELICRVPSEGTLAKVLSELHALPDVISIHVDLPGTNHESRTSTGSTN